MDFHGLKVKAPAKIPGDLMWQLADLEAVDGSAGSGFREIRDVLVTLVGEEQSEAIREAAKGIAFEKLIPEIMELIGRVVVAAGSSTGK